MDNGLEPSTTNIGYFNLVASTVDQVFFLFFLFSSSLFLVILYAYLVWLFKDTGPNIIDPEKQTVSCFRKLFQMNYFLYKLYFQVACRSQSSEKVENKKCDEKLFHMTRNSILINTENYM